MPRSTRPTQTALVGRARALLEAMTDRARWMYAIPRDFGVDAARELISAEGLRPTDEAQGHSVVRYENEKQSASFVVFDSPELEVMLVEAAGPDAPPVLSKLLDKTGYFAQSTLLGCALDVADPEAPKALQTLAHMVVAWDEDWSDLFLLHLASPDPVVRKDAVTAVCVAAMVSRDGEAAIRLLDEALRRERFPKLAETIREALGVIRASSGGPIEIEP